MIDGLSWVALVAIILVILTLAYGIIAIHDIPYNIAKARNHPHQSAIHAGGWISLFTLHAIWPLLWIWAMAYDPKYGYGGLQSDQERESVESLKQRLASLESQLSALQSSSEMSPNRETN